MGVGQALSLRFCTGKNVVVAVGVNASGSRIRMLLMYALLRELGCLSDSPRSKRSALLDWGNPATLAGRYQGADGTELVARVSGARLDLLIVGQDSAHIARVTGSFDADGFLTLASTHSLSGIAIFKDPDTDGPCVQVGLYAYRRISA
jgi:hypothetical protein